MPNTHISVPVGLKKCRRKFSLFRFRKHPLKAVFCSLKKQTKPKIGVWKSWVMRVWRKPWSRRRSYSTTSTEAWILESSSRLCSKPMRTTFFWKHKAKAGEMQTWSLMFASHHGLRRNSPTTSYQINSKVPGEHHSYQTGKKKKKKPSDLHHSRKSQIKEEKEHEYIPPSAGTKPLSRRIFADSAVRLLFPANSLQVFTQKITKTTAWVLCKR